jgi:hypothetical protein
MLNRRRVVGTLLALVLPATLALTAVPSATAAAGPAVPPACAWNDPSLNCVHAPTPDIAALPAPAFTTTYNPKTHLRIVTISAAITPPYPKCPDGGVPYADLPCSFRGLSISPRVYVPGATVQGGGAQSVPVNSPCDFSCTASFNLGFDYHGPATIIIKFGVGDLLATASNDLTSSSYETTIQLPADPTLGNIHVTKPTVVYSGKLKTTTVALAGRGGIPKTGVGGVVVRIVTKGEGAIQGGDTFGNGIGELMVVPGTALHIAKQGLGGATTVTTLGWYAKAASNSGDLFHPTLGAKKMKIAATINLKSAGVPVDATSAIVAVVIPYTFKGTAKVGGVAMAGLGFGQYVLAPIKAGKLAVKLPKSAKLWVYGYTEPIHVIDEGSTMATQSADEFSNIFNLTNQEYIY